MSIPEEATWKYCLYSVGEGGDDTTDIQYPLGIMLIVLWVLESIRRLQKKISANAILRNFSYYTLKSRIL